MHPSCHAFVLFAALLSAQAMLWAEAIPQRRIHPELGLPLACSIGRTCWIANYVDVISSKQARDFSCGPRSYDGHDGVDFAIRDLGVMAQGVPVLASAAGTVRGVRDGMIDAPVTDQAARQRIAGKECGNGVVIDHADGWQTQYCHLRKGSVHVKPGESVSEGTPLGMVGLSGQTEFPHLHFTVRSKGENVDPFSGLPANAGCATAGQSLWRNSDAFRYEPVALYNAGLSVGAPDIAAIRAGLHGDGPFPVSAASLVLWVDIFGVQAGDRIRFLLAASDGQAVLDSEVVVEKTQARRFIYVGAKRTAQDWVRGSYAGEVVLSRKHEGEVLRRAIKTTTRLQ